MRINLVLLFILTGILHVDLNAGSNSGTIPELKNFSIQNIELNQIDNQNYQTKSNPLTIGKELISERLTLNVTLNNIDQTLILKPHSLRSKDFHILTVDGSSINEMSPPRCSTYRGYIEQDQASVAAASITNGKLNACIKLGSGVCWNIQPISSFHNTTKSSEYAVYQNDDIAPHDGACGAIDDLNLATTLEENSSLEKAASEYNFESSCPEIKVCEIAIEADYEFYVQNSSSITETLYDIEKIMNGVSEIYEQQTGITYKITEVIIQTSPESSYTSTDPSTLLEEFRTQWNSSYTDIQRDVAHLFTGKNLDGSIIGISKTSTICLNVSGYGLSQSKYTSSLPSRIALTTHELGHNWSAVHCNGNEDCAIMCSTIGGCSGVIDHFSEASHDAIISFKNTRSCLDDLILYGGGCGTIEEPYLIYTPEHWAEILNNTKDWSKCFRVLADIDLSLLPETDNIIIGNQTIPFIGIFDGNGYTISNFSIYINGPINDAGLFGCVDGDTALIYNIGFTNSVISAVDGTNIGGLVGNLQNGTVEGCFIANSNITGNIAVGGLVGHNSGLILNSYAVASVSGANNTGGLLGYNEGIVSYCYSSGSVAGLTQAETGGLIGNESNGTVVDSFWDINTSGQNISPGGGTGKATAEMKMKITFASAGWDFDTPIWQINEGSAYPNLEWEHKYGGGSGSVDDPFRIYSASQLNEIGTNPYHWDSYFVLLTDIDLGEYAGDRFNIIGNEDTAFTGIFDGNRHTISNFSYSGQTDNVGLFSIIDSENAIVKDLSLFRPNVKQVNSSNAGILAGELRNGIVINCYIEGGTIEGVTTVGGLIGLQTSGQIVECYSDCNISGYDACGGLVGNKNGGVISRCCSTGQTTGANWYTGGMAGLHLAGIISNSYSLSNVEGILLIGGLVGYNEGSIENCFSAGTVIQTNPIGYGAGGLIGINITGSVSGSFWDIESSGQLTSFGGTGKITDEMQMKATYSDVGWDFISRNDDGTENTWRLCMDGSDYPKLAWQHISGDFTCPDGVELIDFSLFAFQWLNSDCKLFNDCEEADIDRSGTVEINDLIYFKENWLKQN